MTKVKYPTDREFAENLNMFPKMLFKLGVFSYTNKKLYAAREFEATIKPNYWNPLFYVAFIFIYVLMLVCNVLIAFGNAFNETYETFTKSRATVEFDKSKHIESV